MSKNLLYLLLIIASGAIYYEVIKPVYTGVGGVMQPEQSVQTLMSLNSQYDTTLSQAEDLVSQAQKLRNQYNNISPEQRKQMEVMVPNSIDKVRLLSEVDGLAKSAGFALSDLSYADGGSSNGKGVAAISFSVKTTYPRFKILMDDFEKSERLFSIDNVSFTAPEKEGDLTTYYVKLDTYFLK